METQKDNPNNRRRRYLINPKFQLPWVLWVFLSALSVIACFIIAIAVYVFPQSEPEKLQPDLWSFSPIIVLVILWILLTILAWIVILMTHKIAGPMYRFQKVINAINNGDLNLPAVILRKKDEFKEVAADLNKMIDKIRTDRIKINNIDKEISRNLELLIKFINDENIEIAKLKEKIKESVENIDKARSDLENFK